jgi:hypothetical protein
MENEQAKRAEWLQLDRECFELEKKNQEAQHQLLLAFPGKLLRTTPKIKYIISK